MATFYGTNDEEILKGKSGDDSLFGFNGDDTLVGNRGDDTLIGGAGDDTALFSGPLANYTITGGKGVVTITDNVGNDGTDTLFNIASARFVDQTVGLSALSSTFNLGDLDGSNGFRLDGVAVGDVLGVVSDLGDFNGDGFDDLILGAFEADPNGDGSGAAYVYFGTDAGFPAAFDLADLDGSNGFRLDGLAAGDNLGSAVAGAGDLNGDGLADLIVGAPDSALVGFDTGSSYVVFGTDDPLGASIDLTGLDGTNGFRIDGQVAANNSGQAVARAGDVNGDGLDDLIIGTPDASNNLNASGSSYVVFGSLDTFSPTLALDDLNGVNGFRIDGSSNTDSGISVSSAGDVNGDDIDDLLIGAQLDDADGDPGNNAGGAYVVFGRDSAFPATLLLENLDGSNGFRLVGVDAGDLTGYDVNDAGDVNGDGYDDLIIGARAASNNGATSGSTYVYFGKNGGFDAEIDLGSLDGSNGFRLDGELPGDDSGFAVSGAGDLNNDGFDDLIVGAFGTDQLGINTGTSYILFGAASGFPATLNLAELGGSTGLRLEGEKASFNSGWDVSTAGDVNGDGFDDVMVAAYGADYNGVFSGSAYVVLGGSNIFPNNEPQGGVQISGSAVVGGTLEATETLQDSDGKGDVSYQWLADGKAIDGADADSLVLSSNVAGKVISVVVSYVDDRGTPESVISNSTAPVALPNAVYSVAMLSGSTGFRIEGEGISDRFGWAVSGAGDVNQDGFADVLIGGPFDDPNGSNSGSAYLVLGKASGFPVSLDLGDIDGGDGIALFGADAGDWAGTAVSDAGDVNGDGIDDFIIGAENADPVTAGVETGAAYVVFGINGALPASIELISLDGSNGFRINGVADNDLTGEAVSAAGDINGDGIDDLLIGSRNAESNAVGAGSAHVVFGQAGGFPASLNLSDLDGSNGFRMDGDSAFDNAGFSVSHLGDVNDDGFDDIAVGAWAANDNGGNSGAVYIVYGKDGGFDAAMNLDDLNGTDGFQIQGGKNGVQAGWSVSSVGDVNGDGVVDILIGGNGADYNGLRTGSAFLVHGSSTGFDAVFNLDDLDGSNGFRMVGLKPLDSLGFSVSGAGDFNNDGLADFLVSSPYADTTGLAAGAAYLIFGHSEGPGAVMDLTQLDGRNGFRIDGAVAEDNLGYSVSGAGDVNGDGFDDVIVGAQGADPNGSLSGAGYVLFGRADNEAPTGTVNILALAEEGQTLFAEDLLVDPEGKGEVSWQWYADGVAIDGATSSSLTLSSLQVGREITVVASYTDGAGWQERVSSDPTAPVTGESRVIGLADLDGENGLRLDGVAANDQAGQSVSSAGDINGDGFDDLIIGAWFTDGVGDNSGSAYVVFGKDGGFDPAIPLSGLDGSDGFRLDGVQPDDHFGVSVSGAGDVNGDGYDDIVIGAENANPNGFNSGATYVVFGKPGAFDAVINPASLNGTDGFVLNGEATGDNSGYSVSGAGDINGDGYGDLLIGAHQADPGGNNSGASYVVFGKADGFGATIDLADVSGGSGFFINGEAAGDELGFAVSAAGDVNGDGFDDFIVGAFGSDNNGADSGSTYLIFGKADLFTSPFNLSDLDGSDGVRLDGDAGNRAGRSLGAAGDINCDGYDDLIIGAHNADPNGNNSGSTFVLFGKPDWFSPTINLSDLDGSDGFRVDGVNNGDEAGRAVSGAGDINGDGHADLLIGARGSNNNGTDAGSTYVLFGSGGGYRAVIDLTDFGPSQGFRVDGAGVGDESGWAVSGAGDVNGDGFDDLFIGAQRANPNGNDSGSGYVLFGSQSLGPGEPEGFLIEGSGEREYFLGSENNDTLLGFGGRDTLEGLAGNDLLDGGDDIDFAIFQGDRDQYTIANTGDQLEVTGPAFDGSDELISLERLRFQDKSVAFDLDGNAGLSVKLLGVMLGAGLATDEELVGIALDIFDNAGLSFEQVMDVALEVVLGANPTNVQVVDLLWEKLIGGATPEPVRADLVGLLDSGTFTQVSLSVLAAENEINLNNIGLTGLIDTGVDYLAIG